MTCSFAASWRGLKFIAAIPARPVIEKILTHLSPQAQPPAREQPIRVATEPAPAA